MLTRKVTDSLLRWEASRGHKALFITGARQVGKTTAIRAFAKKRYRSFAELNFLQDPRAREIFSGSLDANTIVSNLTAFLRMPLEPGSTLVLLDEIQECPFARTAIKFLVEDGRFDYVETGSLLGVRAREVPSYPVGFEERLRMHPLDFEEFCWASGVQKETIETLRTHFDDRTPIPEAIHQTMLGLYYAYMVIGGMPEVVQRYVDTHDVAQAIRLQQDIIDLYRQDISKYADGADKIKARQIFDAMPSQLDDKLRRFVLADLRKTARQNRYESSFLWLADAGVALPCYNVTLPVTPLQANEKRSLFKLFMGDVGLLCAASMDDIQFDLLKGNLHVNLGSIMENVVAQELDAHGFKLHYFNAKRYGEVDFVVQDRRDVIPIEVKSGNDWTSHPALDKLLKVSEWDLGHAYVLCKGNVRQSGAITYLPLYMSMFLEPRSHPETLPYEVDLSALG